MGERCQYGRSKYFVSNMKLWGSVLIIGIIIIIGLTSTFFQVGWLIHKLKSARVVSTQHGKFLARNRCVFKVFRHNSADKRSINIPFNPNLGLTIWALFYVFLCQIEIVLCCRMWARPYGVNCAKTCNCEADVTCHPGTGKCNCPPGRDGSNCQKRKLQRDAVAIFVLFSIAFIDLARDEVVSLSPIISKM